MITVDSAHDARPRAGEHNVTFTLSFYLEIDNRNPNHSLACANFVNHVLGFYLFPLFIQDVRHHSKEWEAGLDMGNEIPISSQTLITDKKMCTAPTEPGLAGVHPGRGVRMCPLQEDNVNEMTIVTILNNEL